MRTTLIALALAACGCASAQRPVVEASSTPAVAESAGAPTTAAAAQVTTSNPAATPSARAVLAYLSDLSRGPFRGALVGQNSGHGSQIADPANRHMGYAALVDDLQAATGKAPAVLGVDYEHDRIFTPAQLHAANAVLIEHWRRGGLVTINWSPHSPWVNDESDLMARPGVWYGAREITFGLDLNDLVDPDSPMHAVWQRKLDRVAGALAELRDAGVVVLWRPMQEMNGNWFWWGNSSHFVDPAPYQRVWRDMHRYFSEVKQLSNLLWVYSPADQGAHGSGWAYPGDKYVDVVGGTAYNDGLHISRYEALVALGKPIGMAEWGLPDGSPKALAGTRDDRGFIEAIRTRYPRVAYWVAWHDWDRGDGTATHHALVTNQHAADLMSDPDVITLDEVPRLGR